MTFRIVNPFPAVVALVYRAHDWLCPNRRGFDSLMPPHLTLGDDNHMKKKVCKDCPSKEMAKEIEKLKKLLDEKKPK